jgi:hypothetical protein
MQAYMASGVMITNTLERNGQTYRKRRILYAWEPPIISTLSGPNILFRILSSNRLIVRDQVSRPYETTGKIIVCI